MNLLIAFALAALAYAGATLSFGPEYLMPKPFDPRLMIKIAPAVARAAQDSGVATRPIPDFDAYREKLQAFVYASGTTMKPIFAIAKRARDKRVVFCEGEEERILRAVQVVVDEGLARPTLIGRPPVIAQRCERFGLRLQAGRDYDVVNTDHDHRYRDYWQTYHRLMARRGVTQQFAKIEMRRRLTLIGAMMVHKGEADGMLSGLIGAYNAHLLYVDQVLGKRAGVKNYYAMNLVMLPRRTVFLCDTYVNLDPTVEQLVEMTTLASEEIRRFGLIPKVALVSHSTFGNSNAPTAVKMRTAVAALHEQMPELELEGEMQADAALNEEVRRKAFPNSRLKGAANCLVFANVDAASGSRNILKQLTGGLEVGPILMGMGNKAHIVSPSVTPRGLLNTGALAGTPVAIYG